MQTTIFQLTPKQKRRVKRYIINWPLIGIKWRWRVYLFEFGK